MTVSHILNSQPVSPKCQVIGKMLSRGLNHFLIDVSVKLLFDNLILVN